MHVNMIACLWPSAMHWNGYICSSHFRLHSPSQSHACGNQSVSICSSHIPASFDVVLSVLSHRCFPYSGPMWLFPKTLLEETHPTNHSPFLSSQRSCLHSREYHIRNTRKCGRLNVGHATRVTALDEVIALDEPGACRSYASWGICTLNHKTVGSECTLFRKLIWYTSPDACRNGDLWSKIVQINSTQDIPRVPLHALIAVSSIALF